MWKPLPAWAKLDGAAQQRLGLAVEIDRGHARRPIAAALLAPGRIAGLPFDKRPPPRPILRFLR